ncbi:hypothetical protein LMG19089_04965 [Ralstonia edaphis]|uniref:DUF262 domain-containing protein n=1 Tax=Ralstonia edaphi TaxID=3058599 RepID=UPI0028F58F6A|nr:DUF262 domain-containing protein [Ralstonia sp. LMG 6871]CAJ0709367.1 hypothetical protein LMG19089_04965 [Ralstonia sp. LMG 6871]
MSSEIENLHDDNGGESGGASGLLEEKYSKQMRQIHPQKIELPISTLQAMIKDQITLNPEFQRRDRWDNKKRSRFVESIIMNVPVPPVFLGEDEYGSYVVLDGRQRLTAIHEFLKNSFPLEDLTVWKELNGLRYADLELQGLNRTLTRRFIPAILLLKESSPEVKYDVFDRLNTGGVKANEMEIRNAVFRGAFTKLLHDLSEIPDFRRMWDIPEDPKARAENAIYSSMEDVELVLRFFALRDSQAIEGRLKDYLGYFMKIRNGIYKSDPAQKEIDEALFRRAVESTYSILGVDAFSRLSPDGRYRKSAPLSDAIMHAMSFVNLQQATPEEKANIKTAIDNLKASNDDFKAAVTSGTNGKGSITTRLTLAKEAVTAAAPNAIYQQ